MVNLVVKQHGFLSKKNPLREGTVFLGASFFVTYGCSLMGHLEFYRVGGFGS